MRDPIQSAPHLSFGAAAEELVADRYRNWGYTILARNWRGDAGELDIVAGRGRIVAFVEVKARRRARIDSPAVAVDVAKQRRLRATAAQWLAVSSRAGLRPRFDVVAVTGDDVDRRVEIFTGAF